MSTHVKDDPAVRDAATREVIAAERDRREQVDAACTRRCATVAECVSMDAICAQYPQVRRLRDAATEVAVDLDLRCEEAAKLEAATARFMLECSERLRAAVVGG